MSPHLDQDALEGLLIYAASQLLGRHGRRGFRIRYGTSRRGQICRVG